MTITTSSGTIPVNPLYFIAKTDDGTTYDSPDYGETTLHSGDLRVGEKTKGVVAFDISGQRPNSIVYEGVLGGSIAQWNIKWNKPKPTRSPAPPFGSSGS